MLNLNEGVRFGLCCKKVMYEHSEEFKNPSKGQVFELALLLTRKL